MITKVDLEKCTGCGRCVRSCSLDVFTLDTAREPVAPCMPACPCGIDIRGVLYLMQRDMYEEALEMVRRSNPFPVITGLLCQHHCESSCIRLQEDAPVNIHALEYFLGLRDTDDFPAPLSEHLARVAVVGSGLTGLSCAYHLRSKGYGVTVFEAGAEAGGRLRDAVLADVLELQLSRLKALGVHFRCNMIIGPHGDVGLDVLLRDFSSCCLATGSGLGTPGQLSGIEPLAQTSDPETLQTASEKIFAAQAPGPDLNVAQCIAMGDRMARRMDCWLRGADYFIANAGDRPVAQPLPPLLPAWPRRSDAPEGLELESAQIESSRCLTCGSKARITHTDDCMTCFSCELSCPARAITVHPFKEALPRTLETSVEENAHA